MPPTTCPPLATASRIRRQEGGLSAVWVAVGWAEAAHCAPPPKKQNKRSVCGVGSEWGQTNGQGGRGDGGWGTGERAGG